MCLTSADSAITERAPPGPASRATVVSRWMKRTARSRTAQSSHRETREMLADLAMRHAQDSSPFPRAAQGLRHGGPSADVRRSVAVTTTRAGRCRMSVDGSAANDDSALRSAAHGGDGDQRLQVRPSRWRSSDNPKTSRGSGMERGPVHTRSYRVRPPSCHGGGPSLR